MTIQESIVDLNYQTESDHLWEYKEVLRHKGSSCIGIKHAFQRTGDCIELDIEERFNFWEEGQPQTWMYANLLAALQTNLVSLKLFRFEPSVVQWFNFDLYACGFDTEDRLVIVYTSGVET